MPGPISTRKPWQLPGSTHQTPETDLCLRLQKSWYHGDWTQTHTGEEGPWPGEQSAGGPGPGARNTDSPAPGGRYLQSRGNPSYSCLNTIN